MKICLVEDEADIAETVESLLSSCGFSVETYASGTDFLARWDRSLCGCLLLDMKMPGKSGLDVLKEITDASKILPVILFTSVMDMQVAVNAGKLGAFDFCPKPFDAGVLLEKVKSALEENKKRTSADKDKTRTIEGIGQLSKRESEVLDLLCQGLTSKEIGAQLNISSLTVDNHRARIFAKMNVKSVTQLVQLATKARL